MSQSQSNYGGKRGVNNYVKTFYGGDTISSQGGIIGPTGPTGPTGPSLISGTIWGQTINWNDVSNSWQITGNSNLALGNFAGQINQSDFAVALGDSAGNENQEINSVAIGRSAGQKNQGINAIAIGNQAGYIDQSQNSIVISALGTQLNGTLANATYIAPIRNSYNSQLLQYNTTTNEITYQPNYFDTSGNLDLSCNVIQDVSGIYFCDGTYIGSGASFDISANQVLVLSGKQDPSGSYAGSSIVSKDRVYQQLNPDTSWNSVNGYYGLAKDAYPALNPSSSGVKAVSTWTQRTAAASWNWTSVCWSAELGLFVVVADGGISAVNRLMTSTDGITWTLRTPASDSGWKSVCWSAELGLFVAVANSGTGVMTSPTGINQWTSRTAAGTNGWTSVCWSAELGLLVAVANNGSNRVMTSPDGINWTTRIPSADNTWNSVCWSAELGIFVAVGSNGTNRVMTSPDGITWTSTTTPTGDFYWQSVCWSAELGIFVAVANTGTGNRVMTSPDGKTWTLRTSAADNSWKSVCWSAELGLFVAVSFSGTGNRVMTSPNGITWSLRTSAADNSWVSVCWSAELGIFVAISTSGTGDRVMTSSLAGRPPTSYNVFDSSFNNIDSIGNWTLKSKSIFSDGNITIDPSNTLIVAGTLDMSLNNIQNVNSLEIDNGTNNALLSIDPSGNLLIDPSNNVVIRIGRSLTATTFAGALNGNASSATQIRITPNGNNAVHYLTFSDTNTAGNINLHTNSGILVNPSTDTITATTFVGDLNGTDATISTSLQVPKITNTASIELAPNTTTGDLILTGTHLQSATSGSNSGQHLRIKLNNVYYKIRLENDS